jgi:phosphopantetheinyl transferase
MCEVLVLHCELRRTASSPVVPHLLSALPYGYRLELERRDEPARLASLAGIALLRDAVHRLRGGRPELRRLRVIDGGRPALEGGPSFSIAHSATRAAVAVSESCEPGLDVEDIGSGGRTAHELDRWTATEATLKAAGAGLRNMREVRLDDDLGGARFREMRLRLRPVTLVEGCIARLASQLPVSVLTVEEVAWPL